MPSSCRHWDRACWEQTNGVERVHVAAHPVRRSHAPRTDLRALALIVVDSSVWIARFRNDDTSAAGKLHKIELSDPDIILVGDLVLLEVLRGARDDRHASRIEKRLREFTIESMVDARLAGPG